jgi:CRP/FNR family cyclic AMP-dependent transcriptional regulator
VVHPTSYWGRLTDTDREAFRQRAVRDRIQAGDLVIRQRSLSRSVLIILSGWAAVITEAVSLGDEPQNEAGNLLGFRGDGDIVGELAAISGGKRSASVRALEDVEVLELTAEDFKQLLLDNPTAHWALTEVLVTRQQEGSDFVQLTQQTISVQVPRILAMLADRVGREMENGIQLGYPRKQEELAALLGISRESVSSALTKLSARGLLEYKGGRTIVRDLEGLRKAGIEG